MELELKFAAEGEEEGQGQGQKEEDDEGEAEQDVGGFGEMSDEVGQRPGNGVVPSEGREAQHLRHLQVPLADEGPDFDFGAHRPV